MNLKTIKKLILEMIWYLLFLNFENYNLSLFLFYINLIKSINICIFYIFLERSLLKLNNEYYNVKNYLKLNIEKKINLILGRNDI